MKETENTMGKAIGYIRVSTEEQANEGVSIEAQKAKLVAYANLYNIELVDIVIDAGESAKSLNRPGIQGALKRLSGDVGLIIYKLDRLTRSVKDWNYLIENYFGNDVRLMSVTDQIDTSTASGRLVLNILMSVAQWEREAIGERTKMALQHKKANGQRIGSVAYGYSLAADGQHVIKNKQRSCEEGCKGCLNLIENTFEQDIITTVKELRNQGYGWAKICRDLESQGIYSRTGKNFQTVQLQRMCE